MKIVTCLLLLLILFIGLQSCCTRKDCVEPENIKGPAFSFYFYSSGSSPIDTTMMFSVTELKQIVIVKTKKGTLNEKIDSSFILDNTSYNLYCYNCPQNRYTYSLLNNQGENFINFDYYFKYKNQIYPVTEIDYKTELLPYQCNQCQGTEDIYIYTKPIISDFKLNGVQYHLNDTIPLITK